MSGTTAEARSAASTLLLARLPEDRWDAVRRALASEDHLALHRLAFEAKVARRAERRSAARPPVGKGSPKALLGIGVFSTVLLGLTVLALGGGLLLIPALIPTITVLVVLAARKVADRPRPEPVTPDEPASAVPSDIRPTLEHLAA